MKNFVIACVVFVSAFAGIASIAEARGGRLLRVLSAPVRGAANVVENRPVRKFLANRPVVKFLANQPVRKVLFGRGCN